MFAPVFVFVFACDKVRADVDVACSLMSKRDANSLGARTEDFVDSKDSGAAKGNEHAAQLECI